ncbi:MAG: hypothetical protein KDH20_02025 [Rhodocyclaceae bacterium]|nr:hypothetical protein [Gammaproteobacteria bacterium]MCB1886360.1 hypothetical protein [Rhodocyclaceae bacterium]
MAQVRGTDTQIALFDESTFGAMPGSPAGKLLYCTTASPDAKRTLVRSNTITNGRTSHRVWPDQWDITAAIAGELAPESSGMWLKHAMGQVATTGVGPYTHTLTLGALPVGLGIEVDYGSQISGAGRYMQYHGLKANQLTLDFPATGPVTFSLDLIGASHTAASAALDASLTDTGHTPWFAWEGTAKEGGSAIAYLSSGRIQVANGLDGDTYTIGSAGRRRAIGAGRAVVTGQIVALFESQALLDKALASTESSIEFTLSRGDGLGSAGNESQVFLVEGLYYEPASPAIDTPDGLKITLNFQAHGDGTTTTGLKCTLKNALDAL